MDGEVETITCFDYARSGAKTIYSRSARCQ